MYFTKTTIAYAAAVLLGTTANGHMVMNSPQPIQGQGKLVQTSPLGDGFPFPCQGLIEVDDGTSKNAAKAGGSITTKFTGSAVHGGGSCQFSLSYDQGKSWKVIYSVVGGCPAEAVGNVATSGTDADGRPNGAQCDNDSGTECVRQFDIPLPAGVKNGKAIYAWTWANKVGNREMYMNCANVDISGGSDDDAFVQALPDMAKFDIAGECVRGQGVFNYANPGKYGKVLEQPADGNEGDCPKGAVPKFDGSDSGSGSGSGGSGGAASSTAAAAAPAPTSSAAADVAAPTGGVFVQSSTAAAAAAPTTLQTSTVAASSPTPAAGAGSGSSSGSGSGSGSSSSESGTCSGDGTVVCMGDGYFGICNQGSAVKQQLAPGTTCNNGVIAKRGLTGRRIKI